MANQMARHALRCNLEVIGEASHNIDTHYRDFPADHPKLPLTFAYQMRNAVVHGYFKADLEIIWRTIHRDLPKAITAAAGTGRDLAGGIAGLKALHFRRPQSEQVPNQDTIRAALCFWSSASIGRAAAWTVCSRSAASDPPGSLP